MNKRLMASEQEVNSIDANTVKSFQLFFLILNSLQLHKAQFEILQKMKNLPSNDGLTNDLK